MRDFITADPVAAPEPVRRKRRQPRHPAEVTADRLGDHLDRWYDTTDGELRDAIALVRDWLDRRVDEPA